MLIAMLKIIFLSWITFDVLVYLLMWYDRKDHHYNFKSKIQDLKDSFEQED